ncbi:unnamed protein product [Ectocarpus sp. 8 AP-2014]
MCCTIGKRFLLRHAQANRLLPFWLHRYLYQFRLSSVVWGVMKRSRYGVVSIWRWKRL